MRLSTVGRYALRAVVDLALCAEKGPVLCREIAERQGISDQYLSQLFLKLRRAGLVESVRGPGGGYVLARDASRIRASDVLRAVEETLDPVFCVEGAQGSTCRRVEGCPTHGLWASLGQAIHEVLDSVTLADLCQRTRGSICPSSGFEEGGTVTEAGESAGSWEGAFNALDGLEDAHAFQQAVLDGIAEPIMVIDADYRVQLMNRAAREFSSAGDVSSQPALCYQISHQRQTPCDGAEHPCPLEQVRQAGQPVTVVHKHRRATGEWRLVELIAAPLCPDGAFQGIVESVRDITERVRAEKELKAARAFRRRLIDEERERIARELHDGLAQLLGYVNTKATAVRLMLESGQTESAGQHLRQLEGAARELFVDLREAIFDLRTIGREGTSLATALKDTVAQFSRLSGLPAELTLTPQVEGLPLTPEHELQLLRIVQESLTNVRKHASANKAWVNVRIEGGILELTVRDDGQGFDLGGVHSTGRPHFGLSMMRERAAAIGAEFYLHSDLGAGTLTGVRLAVTGLVQLEPEDRSVAGVER